MLYNVFRCEIWILGQCTNEEANLGWKVTVFNYINHGISSTKESLMWFLKHQALENIHVLPLPQDKDPLSQTVNLCTLSLTPSFKALL